MVCHESRSAATRLHASLVRVATPPNSTNKSSTKWSRWGRELKVAILRDIIPGASAVPLLAESPHGLVLDLRDIMHVPRDGDPDSETGRRLLELLLAAHNGQIKARLPVTELFRNPHYDYRWMRALRILGMPPPPLPPPPADAVARGWTLGRSRLVALSDVAVSEELRGIAAYHKAGWEFVETVLGGLEARAEITREVLAPLEALWER